jgi:endonuclease/exonuclease/phosphatase family metal-dependent hydrolase
MKWLAAQGADIICAQEHTDKDDWSPAGWKRYRPQGNEDHNEAQSNTIYYNPKTVRLTKKRGAIRMSSPGFRSYRALVWGHFRTRKGNKPIRVAGLHLPAFYNDSEKNKVEYDKQAVKLANWVKKGKNRVIAGDFNGSKGGARMEPIEAEARLSDAVKTGPNGQKIDYVGVVRGGNWKIVETVRGPKFNSDHNCVLVTLETM